MHIDLKISYTVVYCFFKFILNSQFSHRITSYFKPSTYICILPNNKTVFKLSVCKN